MSGEEETGFVNEQAEESSDEDDGNSSSDDSEDEEEEDDGEGDLEDLIDDNPVEQEEDNNEQSGDSDENETIGAPRKRNRSFDDRLEDEDYDLIAENTGIQLQRKKFRRVHGNVLDSDEEDEEGQGQVEGGANTSGGGTMATMGDDSFDSTPQDEDFAQVFGGDSDEDDLPDSQGKSKPGKDKNLEADEVEDEFDFIVDDHGHPIRRRKEDGTYTEPMMMEAQDIFGLDFDPAEFDQVARDGILSGDEEEDDEEYLSENESELGTTPTPKKRKKTRVTKKKKSTIYDVYEPSELERGHFLERDGEIRVTDKPERFQTRPIPVQPPEDDGELEEEAEWVYEQAFVKMPISKQPLLSADKHRSGGPRKSQGGKPITTVPKIKEALNFMRKHSFEVPFIANYRREYIEPELDIHDLWKILRFDEKWTQLQTRKKNMKSLFEKMRDYQFEKVREQPDKILTEDTRALTDEDLSRLDSVSSDEELSDVYAHFLLYYGRDLVAMQNSQVKKKKTIEELIEEGGASVAEELGDDPLEKKSGRRSVKQARKKDFYAICQENGLASLGSKFGLTPEQFGENLRDNYQRHETEQYQIEPEVAAEDYIQTSGYFTSVRAVLQGACHMVAMQISAEPMVRQSLRQVFQSRAVLSVKPTKKGRKIIDDNHDVITMKYLRNKPVREIKGDEFLRLHLAEKDQLLEMKIAVDLEQSQEKRNMATQTYFEEIRALFYRDEFSLLVEKWNAQRAKALAHALLKVLYPLMVKELRTKLLNESKDHVLQSCVYKFRKSLDVASFQPKDEVGPYAKVISCAYTHDKATPSFFCVLDGFGEVIDFRRFNNLAKRKYTTYDKEREEKEEDMKAVKEFISKHVPDAVVISAESRESLSLVEEIKEAMGELEQETDFFPVPVEVMDASVAHVYSKSQRAKDQFPDYPELLKTSISLGRRMQDPLQEFAPLCSSQDNEILSLKLHPLQGELSSDQLKTFLEEELVIRVNDVGIDIGFLQEHPHAVGMLQYACGLGPRKAAAILKNLKQEMVVLQNRSQLVTQCSIGPQVFINLAGFLRMTPYRDSYNASDVYIEVLDDTRIHPETYEWARKMAVDALEYDENDGGDNPSFAVEEILKNPDKLRDLDLDAFAEELERQDYGNKKTTLYDIRNELFEPFKERRVPYAPMEQEELFTRLTGETQESLYEGRLLTCTVVGIVHRKPLREVLDQANPIQDERTRQWKCPFCLMNNFRDIGLVWQHFDDGSCLGQGIGVRTRLENGMGGFILTRNLSDKQVNAPEEKVNVGMTIYARIKSVNMEKFSVDMTCRSSDLADKEGKFSCPKDIYYDHSLAEIDKRKDEAVFKKPRPRLVKRVITHPSFQNVTFEETEKLLSAMDQGEAIFRPSSKSIENLTLTWKVDEGIFQHIDIKERDKPNKFSLGRSLLIGNETYEDLDEILARFVQPMSSFARDLIVNKYYRKANGGSNEELKKLLKDEKAKNSKRIPYFFSASKQLPGKFCLGYQPGSKPRIEYVTVTPDGFRYRNRVHESVNGLIMWFKEHYQDPIPRPVHTSNTTSSGGGSGNSSVRSTPMSGSHIPSHITQNLDYSQLQAAVNTANQRNYTGNTPYTPTHPMGSYSAGTPTPQYGGQQYGSYRGGGGGQQSRGGGGGDGGGGYQGSRGGQPFPGQFGGGGGGGSWRTPSWPSSGGGGGAPPRTPSQSQTPGGGRTPAYTPTQTPHSVSSMYGTPPPPRHGGSGSGGGGGIAPHKRHNIEPPGTPILDE